MLQLLHQALAQPASPLLCSLSLAQTLMGYESECTAGAASSIPRLLVLLILLGDKLPEASFQVSTRCCVLALHMRGLRWTT